MVSMVALFRRKETRKLPPKQRPIDSIMRWGIDHPGIVSKLPKVSKEEWRLRVDGEVENQVTFNWDDFMNLPQTEVTSDFHCVETWSVLDQKWVGVLFKDLVSVVKPKSTANYVWFESYDTYSTSLPLEALMDDDVILAHRLNDEELTQPLGGPMRLVVPKLYAYKSPMWLNLIRFIPEDRLGFWESGFYSNTADPWKDDRYRKN